VLIGDSKRVGGRAISDDFRKDRPSAPGLRVLERFQNHNSRAFAQDESAARVVKMVATRRLVARSRWRAPSGD